MELVIRTVDLRQSGLTWDQVGEIIFPGVPRGKNVCYNACKKAGALGEGAFTKRVFNAYGKGLQIVTKLRDTVVPMA